MTHIQVILFGGNWSHLGGMVVSFLNENERELSLGLAEVSMAILAKSHWDNATSSSCYILDTIISQHQVASTETHYQYLLTYLLHV